MTATNEPSTTASSKRTSAAPSEHSTPATRERSTTATSERSTPASSKRSTTATSEHSTTATSEHSTTATSEHSTTATSEHTSAATSKRRHARRRPGAKLAIVAVGLAALAAAPAASGAPPEITSAGIDDRDRLVATWTLAPGTSFRRVEVATSPELDPDLPGWFADGNFAGFACAPPSESCHAFPDTTRYVSSYPVPRDRRYFLMVTAGGGGDTTESSAIWLIDEARPRIPGDAKAGDGRGGRPATGRPYRGAGDEGPAQRPAPRPAPRPVPRPRLSLRAPGRVEAFRRRGARAVVRCRASCRVNVALRLNGRVVARRRTGLLRRGSHSIRLRPRGATARRLAGTPGGRLTAVAIVREPGSGRRSRLKDAERVRGPVRRGPVRPSPGGGGGSGRWTGASIAFTVAGGAVRNVLVRYADVPCGGVSVTGEVETGGASAPIIGGRFSYSAGTVSVSGQFTGANTASGTFSVEVTVPAGPLSTFGDSCTETGRWIASRG